MRKVVMVEVGGESLVCQNKGSHLQTFQAIESTMWQLVRMLG